MLHVHPSGKYDLKDVDCKEKNEPKVEGPSRVQLTRSQHLEEVLKRRKDEDDTFARWRTCLAEANTMPAALAEPLPRYDCYQYPPFEDDEPPKRGGTTFSVFRK